MCMVNLVLDWMGRGDNNMVRVVACQERHRCRRKRVNQGALNSLGQKTGGSRGPKASLSSICSFCIGKEGVGCWGAGSLAGKHQGINFVYLY